ncbi:hypothetical protein B0H17DRAFT_1123568 [Mycena rosella]|uniref:Uncharacterized protein n=1 Tax=Mycena rosella TaxID=1033263 RepID=A0AAD7MC90_MYCRO|nr:hypothetical protein B0H17DRAFT_1123568 [Mycena rosella]
MEHAAPVSNVPMQASSAASATAHSTIEPTIAADGAPTHDAVSETSSAAAAPANSSDARNATSLTSSNKTFPRTTLVEAPHEDLDVASAPEHPLGATDLALLEASDAGAQDDVCSPEPPSPPLDALVRLVVQAADKLTASDTGETEAAATTLGMQVIRCIGLRVIKALWCSLAWVPL